MHRVVITGMGWVTPMGHDLETVWARLLRGESGIADTTLFDASTFPTRISAEVKGFRFADHVADTAGHDGAGRNTQFALAAAAQAWTSAGLPPLGTAHSAPVTSSSAAAPALDLDRVGVYLGSGEGSLDFEAFTRANLAAWQPEGQAHDASKFAELALQLMDVTRELEQEPNMPLSHLAILTGARGPAMNCLTACAASTQAIGEEIGRAHV